MLHSSPILIGKMDCPCPLPSLPRARIQTRIPPLQSPSENPLCTVLRRRHNSPRPRRLWLAPVQGCLIGAALARGCVERREGLVINQGTRGHSCSRQATQGPNSKEEGRRGAGAGAESATEDHGCCLGTPSNTQLCKLKFRIQLRPRRSDQSGTAYLYMLQGQLSSSPIPPPCFVLFAYRRTGRARLIALSS